jgi:acyl-CoA synthetase (AMP-forming)/AMP-acid ligase II
MDGWNLAEVYEALAQAAPGAPCQRQGERLLSWGDTDARANGLASDLLAAGLAHQAKVAAYLYNCPEYLETYLAAFKSGLVPVNTNYRYRAGEVAYLLDNSDAEAVVFHSSLAGTVEEVRGHLPRVRRWYAVDDGGGMPGWAIPYEEVVSSGEGGASVRGPWGRSGDDLMLLYTGGTTGLPKGVIWRQDDLFNVLGAGGNPVLGLPSCASVEEVARRRSFAGLSLLPACPLMHGTGLFSALINWNGGGCVVTLPGRRFDPFELWETVARYRVRGVSIVGDAFARPMLACLEANPGRWDLSCLLLIVSSGVMWSKETKAGLMAALPQVLLWDSLGSSEGVGLAEATATGGEAQETATFRVGERVQVLDDAGRAVSPGSGEVGMVAISGFIPLGYYKDPAKTARSFREVDGVRYSIPGDYATVGSDGSLHLLGRGSVVINTGGEKVFPEEVEEVLKGHPAVADAVCVSVPDERFGEAVCALVELVGGKGAPRSDLPGAGGVPGAVPGGGVPGSGARPADPVLASELADLVRRRLARYKAPRRVLIVPSIGRSPAGKVDYPALAALAREVPAEGPGP